jgi:signal transduction histidine kinase
MYERAELLGGRLWIQSATGRGTRVSLDLPIREAAG